MALDKLAYGTALQDTPPEVQAERATAGADIAKAQGVGGVSAHVTYETPQGRREIEIGQINHKALGRPTDAQYERNRASVQSRLNQVGVAWATVVSFLPMVLHTDSLLIPSRASNGKIGPPKDKEDYATYVFKHAFIEPGRRGADSPLLATDWHPIQMANEFPKLYPQGVFAFRGDASDLTDPAWLKRTSNEDQHYGRTYGQVMEDTRKAAVAWMHEHLRYGNERDRQKQEPTLPQKAAARRLLHLGFIKEMPKWVEQQRDTGVKIPVCPKCQKPSEPGAPSCTNAGCGYIIDPRKAYEIQAIGEEDLSMERLTRKEVEEMGISAYVAETIDEKKNRLSLGLPKPLSAAAMRLKDAEDEYQNMRQDNQAEKAAAAVGEAVAKSVGGKTAKQPAA
jgi:hypothetical protein